MKIIYSILSVIYKNNSFWKVPFIIIKAAFYIFYQRLTGRIISRSIFNGKQIFLFPYCPVSSMFYYVVIPDNEEISLLRKYADDNTVFIDIGANIGSYSIMMMDLVKDIIAFEPHPYTASRCKMNFLLNGYDEGKVKQIALSDVNSSVNFSNLDNGSSVNRIIPETQDGIIVEAKTLDSFIDNITANVSNNYLLKIDVEGSELNVINGASRFFSSQNIRGIIFESFDDKFTEVKSALSQQGFIINKISANNYFAQRAN